MKTVDKKIFVDLCLDVVYFRDAILASRQVRSSQVSLETDYALDYQEHKYVT